MILLFVADFRSAQPVLVNRSAPGPVTRSLVRSLAQTSLLRVYLNVPENMAECVKEGEKAFLTLDEFPRRQIRHDEVHLGRDGLCAVPIFPSLIGARND